MSWVEPFSKTSMQTWPITRDSREDRKTNIEILSMQSAEDDLLKNCLPKDFYI